MPYSRIFITTVFGFLFASSAIAQENGLVFNYKFGSVLNQASHVPSVVNPGFGIGDGTGAQHTFRLSYDRNLLTIADITLSGQVGLMESIGNFSAPSSFTLAYSGTFAHTNASLHIPASPLDLSIGGWLDIPMTQKLTQTLANGTQTNAQLLYGFWPTGVRLEAAYKNSIIDGFPIQPSLFAEFDFSAYRQPSITPIQASNIGLSLQWRFGSSDTTTLASVLPGTTSTALHAAVHFTYHDRPISPNELIPIEEHDTLYRQYVMMPSAVPPFFHHLLPNVASQITIDSFAHLDENQLSEDLPNVIGLRLRADPNGTLVIRSKNLSSAHSTESYLQHAFGISTDRIKSDTGRSEELEFVASDPAQTDPIVTQWIERSYSMDDIGIVHHIEPESELDWTLAIQEHGGTSATIAQSSARGTAVSLNAVHPHNAMPIVALFTVRDSLLHRTVATDTLYFKVVSKYATGGTLTSKLRYVVLADTLQQGTIDRMLQKIRELEHVTHIAIEYYFDKSGFPQWLQSKLNQAGLHGSEANYALAADDKAGPRVVITAIK